MIDWGSIFDETSCPLPSLATPADQNLNMKIATNFKHHPTRVIEGSEDATYEYKKRPFWR